MQVIIVILQILIFLIIGSLDWRTPNTFINKCFQVIFLIIFISVLLYVLVDGFKRYNKCKNETPEEYEKRLEEEEKIEEWRNKF